MADTDDMVEGYRDGLSDHRDEYPAESNRSASYAHGWRNGRDDRKRNPRATAQILREAAVNAKAKDAAA